MKFNENGICDENSWAKLAPPMASYQWADGRSAKELARYITKKYPCVPGEIEELLKDFSNKDIYDFKAEYVTALPRKGNGRNHDCVIYNDDVFVGIEGKADEQFGNKTVKEELKGASENKTNRINALLDMLFDKRDEAMDLRYQLVTGSCGVLLEAKEKNVKNAVFLIIVFKKEGKYLQEKIDSNNKDLDLLLNKLGAKKIGDNYYVITTPFSKEQGINFYLKKFEVNL